MRYMLFEVLHLVFRLLRQINHQKCLYSNCNYWKQFLCSLLVNILVDCEKCSKIQHGYKHWFHFNVRWQSYYHHSFWLDSLYHPNEWRSCWLDLLTSFPSCHCCGYCIYVVINFLVNIFLFSNNNIALFHCRRGSKGRQSTKEFTVIYWEK